MPPDSEPDVTPRRIDQQNRVALPPEILEVLDAEAGDYVTFEVEGGDVRVVKVKWVAED